MTFHNLHETVWEIVNNIHLYTETVSRHRVQPMCTISVILNQSQGDDLINQIKFGNSKLTSQFIDSHFCFGLVPDKQDGTFTRLIRLELDLPYNIIRIYGIVLIFRSNRAFVTQVVLAFISLLLCFLAETIQAPRLLLSLASVSRQTQITSNGKERNVWDKFRVSNLLNLNFFECNCESL